QGLGRISATEDDEVIGIRDDVRSERLPAPGQPPILQEPVHVDVGEQWARDAALRRAARVALATTDAPNKGKNCARKAAALFMKVCVQLASSGWLTNAAASRAAARARRSTLQPRSASHMSSASPIRIPMRPISQTPLSSSSRSKVQRRPRS